MSYSGSYGVRTVSKFIDFYPLSTCTDACEQQGPIVINTWCISMQAGQPAHEDADAPGDVQKQLAGFLQSCPKGVVVLEDVQKLHPQLLPVFINALSEQGSFEVIPLY